MDAVDARQSEPPAPRAMRRRGSDEAARERITHDSGTHLMWPEGILTFGTPGMVERTCTRTAQSHSVRLELLNTTEHAEPTIAQIPASLWQLHRRRAGVLTAEAQNPFPND